MVRGVPAALFFVPLEHGEVGDPQEAEVALVEGAVPLGILLPQREPKLSCGGVDVHTPAGASWQRWPASARFAPATMTSRSSGLGFASSRIFATVSGYDFSSRLMSSKILAILAVAKQQLDVVTLLARQLADLRNDNRDNRQLRIDVQRRKLLRRERLAHLGHRRQAHVGLVDAVLADRLVVAHARKRRFELDADGLPRRGQKAFDHGEDRLRAREADLQIDLRELGLAVGAQVFVAEAAHDLEVLVEARDHQDLLEESAATAAARRTRRDARGWARGSRARPRAWSAS